MPIVLLAFERSAGMGERETMINDMIEVVVLQTHKDINLI
jgi:hypothetical protein